MPEGHGAGPSTPLAIIAGHGALPREIAERRAACGQPYVLVIFQDCFEPWMSAHPHQFHEFERAGALFRQLRREGVTHFVFAGSMNRPKIRLRRLDLKAVGIAARALTLLRKGDDAMLRGFASIIEQEGLSMIGPQDVLGGALTIQQGALGEHRPNSQDLADAVRAAAIVRALGPLDVGQGAVVAAGVCLAVEAIEGTDLMLARVADLPIERRASGPPPCGVLFKGPKPDQDRRMDLPTIGPETVAGAARAGLRGIMVAADETALLDRLATREAADQAGLFIYGASPAELAG